MYDCQFAGPQFSDLLADLAGMTGRLEADDDCWPAQQLERLAEAGVLGWVIPAEFGGKEISAGELTQGYIRLASACLTTAFVLTQFNGACQRIAGSDNDVLKNAVLADLCTGRKFATVGISHLTTSRQHLSQPAVRVSRDKDRYVYTGNVPWVTGAGAGHADFIVTGGTCDDGKQLLAVVPTDNDGVTVNAPPRLLSMNASQTASVDLQNVALGERWVIAGPVENVMKQGTGSLTTSALAVGATEGTLKRLHAEAQKRPDLVEIYEPLAAELDSLTNDVIEAGGAGDCESAETPESIRKRANSLVMRAAQAYLGAAKGAGFVRGHPAERAIREAMFFLVWSCPQPVLTAALREFACIG